jgi:hypothetical protein
VPYPASGSGCAFIDACAFVMTSDAWDFDVLHYANAGPVWLYWRVPICWCVHRSRWQHLKERLYRQTDASSGRLTFL